jgi:hypothetical protein
MGLRQAVMALLCVLVVHSRGVKLPNSGDTLKVIVPSNSRKAISGWSNYSEKVTSYYMSENEMGNRGSKSAFNAVKEQRADGNCIEKNSLLRCVLTGCESSYPIKYHSKQIKNIRTLITTRNGSYFSRSEPKAANLNAWFITGFSDAESCFSINILKNDNYKTGWRVKPVFSIGLHIKDKELLYLIQQTLGTGLVHIFNNKSEAVYSVESFKELEKIITHFNNYPLVTAKRIDFIIFQKCFEIIKEGNHLTENGLLEIISLKTALNLGLSESLSKAFPNVKSVDRIPFVFQGIPDPNWISGFTSGDGSFNLKIGKTNNTSIGVRIQLRFGIGLHIRELEVIKGIAAYFNLLIAIEPLSSETKENNKYKYIDIRTTDESKQAVTFQITKYSDIKNIIIPFFDEYPIQGQKALDFEDFKKVSLLMENKLHLTDKGLLEILKIKEQMNQLRINS